MQDFQSTTRGVAASLLLGCALLLCTVQARASQSARLVYSRSEEAQACADEAGVREAVARRLGYDPFVAASPRSLVVELTGEANGLKARVYLIESGGLAGGTRELTSPSRDCAELLAAVALAISIAIDPDAIDRPSTPSPDAAVASEAPSAEPAATAKPPEKPAPNALLVPELPTPADRAAPSHPRAVSRLRWALGTGAFVATGPVPAPALGAMLLFGIGGNHWAVSLEPRWLPPASTAARSESVGTAQVSAYGGTVSPCYRSGSWLGCYVLDAALVVSQGRGISLPSEDRSFWLAQGPRLAYRVGVGAGFGVTLRLDGLWAAQTINMRIDGSDVYQTPRFLLRFGVDAAYEL